MDVPQKSRQGVWSHLGSIFLDFALKIGRHGSYLRGALFWQGSHWGGLGFGGVTHPKKPTKQKQNPPLPAQSNSHKPPHLQPPKITLGPATVFGQCPQPLLHAFARCLKVNAMPNVIFFADLNVFNVNLCVFPNPHCSWRRCPLPSVLNICPSCRAEIF